MKILWLTNTPSQASDTINVQLFTQGWVPSLQKEIVKQEGIELGLVFPNQSGKNLNFEKDKTHYFSFPLVTKNSSLTGFIGRWNHPIEQDNNLQQITGIVDSFKPDLIHVFGTEHEYGLIADLVKIPVVIQIQGNVNVVSKKWYSGISFLDVTLHSSIKNLILGYGIWHYYYQFLRRAKRELKVFSTCRNYIGRTDWDRRITGVLSPGRKYFHCNEIIRENFYHLQWNPPQNKEFTIFSTLSPFTYKGLEMVLESTSILRKRGLNNLVWKVAGVKGNEEIIRIIEKTYKLKYQELNIQFLGSLQAVQLGDQLCSADLFIHPSHIENSPNSLCEAMLIGMPVISTYAGGIPSLVIDKTEGLLVQDGDPFALAGAIIDLMEDKSMAVSLGQNARKTALSRHDPVKIAETTVGIYSQLLFQMPD